MVRCRFFQPTDLNANTLPQQADKLRNQQELERLQAKYVGTGHPDTTSWEWKTNIHRDTYSSIAGHPPLLSYIALAENEPVAKVRVQMIRVCCLSQEWPSRLVEDG
jgi:splicing factor 3B subunit 5